MYQLKGGIKMPTEYNEFVQIAIDLFLKGRGTLLKVDSILEQVTIQMNDSLNPITLPLSRFTIVG